MDQYLASGLFSIGIFWSSLFIGAKVWGIDSTKTVSQHAARHKNSAVALGAVIFVTVVTFVYFLVGYMEVFEISNYTRAFFFGGAFLMVLGGLVPEVGRWKKWHVAFALGGYHLLVASCFLVFAEVRTWATSLVLLAGIWLVYCDYLILRNGMFSMDKNLYYQLSTIAVFDICLLLSYVFS